MDLNLSGKKALICGSSDGIGKAAAEEIARMGASVTLLARNPEKLEKVKSQLSTAHGQQHQILVADFDDLVGLESELSAHLRAGNDYNILVNNSGGPPAGPAHKAGLEEYVTAFRRHLLANQLISQALLEGMRKSGYGRIINISSTVGLRGYPYIAAYTASKHAVIGLTRTLALESVKKGITVNAVCPGYTDTDLVSEAIDNIALTSGRAKENIKKEDNPSN